MAEKTNNGRSSNAQTKFTEAFKDIKQSEHYTDMAELAEAVHKKKLQAPATTNVSKNCLIVSSRQRGNPLLKYVRNVPYEYNEIVPDYVMGLTTCALFLSLQYHMLNPNYIHERMKILGRQYLLRVLLVQIDVKNPTHELQQLTKICVLADFTLMLAWNPEEAAGILETYKIFEHKPPDMIMSKTDDNPYSMMVDALTSIKSVNRSDAMSLLATFGSLENIVNASVDEISMCPGFGLQKAQRLCSSLQQNFKKSK